MVLSLLGCSGFLLTFINGQGSSKKCPQGKSSHVQILFADAISIIEIDMAPTWLPESISPTSLC